MKRKIHLICNAHLDPVWLWQWQEGAAEAVSTFRTAVELCENDKRFIFNHNEVILYEWIRMYEPSLFKRIKKLVKAGRWRIMGGWYLQPDCNMPSGESFVRQILTGREYFKKHFGIIPTTAINFDPFGHSRGLVQIMAKSGYDSYLFGRPGQQWKPIKDEPFIWVGFDGSEITARRFVGWYNTALGKSREQVELRIKNSPNQVEAVLWGVGNHGGGPSRKDLRDINNLIEESTDTEILHSTPEEYFAEINNKKLTTNRLEEDLNPWAIGCYTSMIRVKQKHRHLENELYITEKMATAAAVANLIKYPKKELLEARKDMMLVQFHDILPGSSIQPVEEDSLRTAYHGLEILSKIKATCFFALARSQKRAEEGTIPIMVYSTYPYEIEDTIECEFNLPDFRTEKNFVDIKIMHEGKSIPVQIEKEDSNHAQEWRKRVVFRTNLRPFEINRFDCTMEIIDKKPEIQNKIQDGNLILGNDRLEVVINAKTGLMDKYSVDGIDYIKAGAFCPVVLDDNEDPWEVKEIKFGEVIGKFELMDTKEGSKFSGFDKHIIESVRIIEDGAIRTVVEAVLRFEESFICQQYKIPKNGCELEIQTRVFWNQKDKMLKLRVPLDSKAQKFLGQTAYGVQQLPNNGNEAVAQKWIATINENKCLTCINDGVYGFDCDKNILRLSLLRSPAYSAHPIEDNQILPTDRFTQRIDQGEHLFKFWLNAGNTEQRLESIGYEALMKNEKNFALSFFPNGVGREPQPLIKIDNKAIELSALKQAENNTDWIIRLFNSTEKQQTAQLSLPPMNIKTIKNICFTAYEIKTFRIDSKGNTHMVNLMEEFEG